MARNSKRSEERHQMMMEMEPKRLICKMALPAIVALIVDSFYNLADTFFVSSIGVNATSAVAVNDSFMHVLLAISGAFAFGLSIYTSRLLGAKKDERASRVASTTLFTGIITALVVISCIWPVRAWLVDAIGATPDALKYSVDYATYILLAFPFTMCNNILNQTLKSEGNTTYAMVGTVSGCIVNCILDPIFIQVLGWEVAGAAGATALSKVFSFCVLVFPFIRKTTIIRISPKNIKYDKEDFFEVAKNGLPTFLRMNLITFGSILTNRTARLFGTSVLAAISIANKIYRFISSVVMGFGQGFAPCAGYCWGAKAYERTKKLYYVTISLGAAIGFVCSVIMFLTARSMVGIFNNSNDPVVFEIGMFKLRALCIALIPHIFVMMTNSFYQALGKPIGSTILGLSRQLLFLIPMVLILPKFFGVYGLASAQGVSDFLSAVLLAVPFAIHIIRVINRAEAEYQAEQSKSADELSIDAELPTGDELST